MDFSQWTEFGLAGLVIAALFWYIIKKDNFIKEILDKNEQRHQKFTESIDANTEVTKETHKFLVSLNGKLEGAAKDKIKESK